MRNGKVENIRKICMPYRSRHIAVPFTIIILDEECWYRDADIDIFLSYPCHKIECSSYFVYDEFIAIDARLSFASVFDPFYCYMIRKCDCSAWFKYIRRLIKICFKPLDINEFPMRCRAAGYIYSDPVYIILLLQIVVKIDIVAIVTSPIV